jgi:hypothetical protein
MQVAITRLNWERLAETAQRVAGLPSEGILSDTSEEIISVGDAESDVFVEVRTDGNSERVSFEEGSVREVLLKCEEEDMYRKLKK